MKNKYLKVAFLKKIYIYFTFVLCKYNLIYILSSILRLFLYIVASFTSSAAAATMQISPLPDE